VEVLQRRYEAKPMSRMPKCSGGQLNVALIVPAGGIAPMWARAASYTDRILHGEKPTDPAVQAPTNSNW
jgi:hypothetical protein